MAKRNLYPQLAKRARRRATWIAWAPVGLIILVVVLSAAIHLSGRWTSHCEERWLGKLDCDLVGIPLVVALGASLFALIIISWWRLTGLDGLKRIFEVSWPGLDDGYGDVDTVGAGESVIRAAAWIVTILASLFLVAAALVAASDYKRFRSNPDAPRSPSHDFVERHLFPRVILTAGLAVPPSQGRAVGDGHLVFVGGSSLPTGSCGASCRRHVHA